MAPKASQNGVRMEWESAPVLGLGGVLGGGPKMSTNFPDVDLHVCSALLQKSTFFSMKTCIAFLINFNPCWPHFGSFVGSNLLPKSCHNRKNVFFFASRLRAAVVFGGNVTTPRKKQRRAVSGRRFRDSRVRSADIFGLTRASQEPCRSFSGVS